MIKVAVVGTGGISQAHLEAYSFFPERCKVVCICDIYPEKAAALKEKFKLDCDIVGEASAVADRDDIDLVSICTPPYTHAELSIEFLRSGKHVLVEKPMASSLSECDQMIAAAEQANKILSVVGQNRFRDPIMKLKQLLDAGAVGKVLHAQVESHWWRGHVYYDLWWRGTWEKEGGGCTLNHAVHHIDMLQWMMGMPDTVQAVMSNTAHDNAEVEDLSIAILSYANGALAQITSSVVHHGEEQQVIFQAEKARVSAPWKVYASLSKENGFPERNAVLEAEIEALYGQLPEVPYSGHTGQIDNVLTAVENATLNVLVDGHQGRNTLELITAIYLAASTGQKVQLPLQPDNPFYTREGIMANAPHFYEKKSSVTGFAKNDITLGSDYTEIS
ncbi:Gfo/Idh/MocA family protein [Paenibacillus xerothermodurans]|uniref:Gfo/Idh/MocA family oxidoreductase n=1 Tax=Paenibacillus xerothermodurans TaxID=1977292 RepID=A0A2W1NWH2_PAEXE|nr:Gfo/Idh/MocA family oxidoreductase [Paenibacillus xerothermodurans]PZE20012.1 gfo/Idh/MocA family oxidoreductase [Paenibacillus xerothermodurans]